MAATAMVLTKKGQAFLNCLNWMENSATYVGQVFVLDIDFDNFGTTLYGPQGGIQMFKADMEKYSKYIEEMDNGLV